MSDAPPPSGSVTPKVSVAMITYNHERFIAQAIESVLMQQTSFPIELVIGEDCSTDGTRKIVEQYARLRPDVIRPLLHTKNLGIHGNGRAVLCACRGEFIAYLEGDDYWTDPQKLSKQVTELEADANLSMSYHRVEGVDESGNALGWQWPASANVQTVDFPARIAENIITASVMLRGDAVRGLDFERIKSYPVGDYPIFILACRGGQKVHFINACMAAYRRHPGGMTSKLGAGGPFLYSMGIMWEDLAKISETSTDKVMENRLWGLFHFASRHFADEGKLYLSLAAHIRSLRYVPIENSSRVADFLKNSLRVALAPMARRLPTAKRLKDARGSILK